MSQTKNQKIPSEKKLNKMEANNLPDMQFKTLVTRVFKELRGKTDQFNEDFNRDSKHKKDI